MDLDLKSKRIVYQMCQELEKTPFDHDFHNALLSLPMPDLDKRAGFDGFLKLQNDIKESLKAYTKNGEKSALLKRLSGQQMKCVNQMLSKEKSTTNSSGRSKTDRGQIRFKNVKAVEEEEIRIPRVPVPFGIPPLEVNGLYRDRDSDDKDDDDDEEEWLNSRQSSSRAHPEIPMEPIPVRETPEPLKSVKFVDSDELGTVPARKIASRARPIQKSDAQIQTEQEEDGRSNTERSEKITAEIGTNCRILITPRVEEDYAPSGISIKSSPPPLSPISTVLSEGISEGEVIRPIGRITVVRTDGSIVPTPRVIEDTEEENDDDVTSENILIAKSSSPFGVADIEMSMSSAHSI